MPGGDDETAYSQLVVRESGKHRYSDKGGKKEDVFIAKCFIQFHSNRLSVLYSVLFRFFSPCGSHRVHVNIHKAFIQTTLLSLTTHSLTIPLCTTTSVEDTNVVLAADCFLWIRGHPLGARQQTLMVELNTFKLNLKSGYEPSLASLSCFHLAHFRFTIYTKKSDS